MLRITVLLALLGTPLMAQDKQDLCNTTGDIANAAVLARVDGLNAADAETHVVKSLPKEKDRFKPAVEPIVNWVYTLPPEQLTDEVGTAYVAACMAQ